MSICIKNVDSELWNRFKTGAAKHGLAMNQYLAILIEEHENRENSWNNIISRAGKITEKEAEELRRRAKTLRKDFSFR